MGFFDFLTARKHGDLRHARLEPPLPFDGFAQRIKPVADWGALVLPDEGRRTLREIAAHVRRRPRLHERWGFFAKHAGHRGSSVLLSGGSAGGRMMAAEVLARDLQRDLIRVDLSAVVSKYLGETEKNLRRLFDAAENGGSVLFFDEADALFGKRTEVKDSHDRYANAEVSYLLERMERFTGLAIVAANRRQNLDEAFTRRLHYRVEFPDPHGA
jgi:SpoVK/Ycf46/Vps4 family AAA+-type ATPase